MSHRGFFVPAFSLLLAGATFLGPGNCGALAPISTSASMQEPGWDAPPNEWTEVQRRGFRDGLEGARRDFDNHRSPNVENREEYRHPDVPGDVREAYREGFRRGYNRAVSHFWGTPEAVEPPPPQGGVMGAIGGLIAEWENPPQEFNEVQRHGFHDGVNAARRDFAENRRPDFDDHQEFRMPPTPPELAGAYREAFRRGYSVAQSHLTNPGSPVMGAAPMQWDAPPAEYGEFERRGFHDGIEGAHKDFDNHRRPDVDNRDEFRHPNAPPEMWEPYRRAFRRGYELAMQHLMGGGPAYR